MLVALGVRPTMAVIIALLGQAWGNTFGTLAVAWDVLAQISGIAGTELHLTARYTALLLWILNLAAGALICWLYDRGRGLRQGAQRRDLRIRKAAAAASCWSHSTTPPSRPLYPPPWLWPPYSPCPVCPCTAEHTPVKAAP